MTLYEIDARLEALMNSVDPETGEWDADPQEWEQLSLDRAVKLENTALYIKNLAAETAAIKTEEDMLRARRTRLERKMDWLRNNLSRSLAGENFETSRCQVRFKKNPMSVQIRDEAQVLAWAIDHRQDLIQYGKPTIKKAGIKQLLEQGEEIRGAELCQNMRMEVK